MRPGHHTRVCRYEVFVESGVGKCVGLNSQLKGLEGTDRLLELDYHQLFASVKCAQFSDATGSSRSICVLARIFEGGI